MGRLADIMACLELRFVQERGEDGQLTYRLDPCGYFCLFHNDHLMNPLPHRPIDVFVTYDSKRAVDITLSRYAVRHIVAQEV